MKLIKHNFFYILEGKNGATYIFNVSSWKNIGISLEFYRAYTLKGKVQSSILTYFLFVVGIFFSSSCKSKSAIKLYLKENINSDVDFNLDENSSVLISPTRDKVIVNHHTRYFHKFAFGKSFKKVKNESVIYKSLQNPKKFQVASVLDLKIDEQLSSCNFKLLNPPLKSGDKLLEIDNLPEILVEFFNSITQKKTIRLTDYIEDLLKRLHLSRIDSTNSLKSSLVKIQKENEKETIPLGLVHRDFKPWNTLLRDSVLIFDFEETIIDGPPLEDLFNYLIDPIIMNKTSEEICSFILNKLNVNLFKLYLNELNLKLDFNIFLNIYLINRILFLKADNKNNTSNKYIELYNHMNMK